MADPLSLYANEEDDIEKYLDVDDDDDNNDEVPVSNSPPISHHDNDHVDGGDVSGVKNVNHAGGEGCSKIGREDDIPQTPEDQPSQLDNPSSVVLENADIIAKIEEEMESGPKDLDITVDTPEKIVKTMESYIAFTVKTKTTRSDFEDPEYTVKRRYNDFLWLRTQLEERHPALVIPPLPEKHNLTIDRFDKDFVKFREVALHRFMERIAQHPVTARDDLTKAFVTLDYVEFQTYKKRGTGLLSRVTKSLSTMGGSYMLKNRAEEYTKMYDYAQSLGEKLGAFERITNRVTAEQQDYLSAMSGYISAYENWSNVDESLSGNLMTMSNLMKTMRDDTQIMVDQVTLKTVLPAKEYVLYSDTMKNSLARRDAIQHELEVLTEELVKCGEEKKSLEDGGSAGFLSRSNTEEAIKLKLDKLTARLTELEGAHKQCKARLEGRNIALKTDLERWHINKKTDMKEMLGGLASRHIHNYDQHIKALEEALSSMKETLKA